MEQRAETESDAPEAVSLLRTHIGKSVYALEVGHVDKVSSVPRLTAVPHSSGAIAGIGRGNGDIVVYLDGGVLTGTQRIEAETAVLLDRPGDQMPVGLLVDETSGMESVPVDRIVPAETVGLDTTVFAAAITGGDELRPVFGPDRLVAIADQRPQS